MSRPRRVSQPTHADDVLGHALQACRLSPSDCVLHHVTRTSRAVVAVFDEALKPSGLTGHQFNLLMTLAQAGPLNVSTLARYIGVDPTTIPRALIPLKRDRLAAVTAGVDRRERLVAITAVGRRRLATALPRWEALQRSILESLGPASWDSLIADFRRIRQATVQPAPSDSFADA